jgi:hypothetical protein
MEAVATLFDESSSFVGISTSSRTVSVLLVSLDNSQKHKSDSFDDLMKYVPTDQHKEWHEKAIEVAMSTDHHWKSGFMPGIERLMEETGPNEEPSFLERAKARWKAK